MTIFSSSSNWHSDEYQLLAKMYVNSMRQRWYQILKTGMRKVLLIEILVKSR